VALIRNRFGPPDYVGVGTQRSGTTWWNRMILQHPQVRQGNFRRKELHFFEEFCGRPMGREDVRRYHAHFPRRRGDVVGEWTPRYLYDTWTPRLLARAAPEAKLLVLLRDPVERFRSGLAHQAHVAPTRRKALAAADAIDRGRYATQLERLFRFFDPAQVLVLQYERCRRDPEGEYARTVRFLGVEDGFVPPDFFSLQGKTTTEQKLALWPDLERTLHAVYAPERRRLRELVPDLDLSLWRGGDG
jgi:hypothetical protein